MKRKFKKVDIEQLQAYELAYGHQLTKKDMLFSICSNGVIFAFFIGIMTFYIWTTVLAFILGSIYGYYRVMPQQVKADYYRRAYAERNRVLNVLTQTLTNDQKTIFQALSTVVERADGELKHDLSVLVATISNATNDEIEEAFKVFTDKYKDDVVFVQYFEQVETAVYEGRMDLGIFTSIKNFHNNVYESYKDYEAKRKENKQIQNIMTAILAGLIVAIAVSFGLRQYISAFPHSVIGYVVTAVFVGINAIWRNNFYTYYFDNSITSYQKSGL